MGGMVLSVDSDESEGFTSKYALRPLEEQVNLGVEKTVLNRVIFVGKVRRAKRRGEEAYHLVDLRAGMRVGPTVIYLDGNNLFDVQHPDITGSMAPGRAVYLGLEIRPAG